MAVIVLIVTGSILGGGVLYLLGLTVYIACGSEPTKNREEARVFLGGLVLIAVIIAFVLSLMEVAG